MYKYVLGPTPGANALAGHGAARDDLGRGASRPAHTPNSVSQHVFQKRCAVHSLQSKRRNGPKGSTAHTSVQTDLGALPQVMGEREAIQGFVLKKLLHTAWPNAAGKKSDKSIATEVS